MMFCGIEKGVILRIFGGGKSRTSLSHNIIPSPEQRQVRAIRYLYSIMIETRQVIPVLLKHLVDHFFYLSK
jgi:hypothetical protein